MFGKKRGKHWVDDKDATACNSCTSTFTLTNRKHHCRVCGGLFCGNCARHTWGAQGRVCEKCYTRLKHKAASAGGGGTGGTSGTGLGHWDDVVLSSSDDGDGDSETGGSDGAGARAGAAPLSALNSPAREVRRRSTRHRHRKLRPWDFDSRVPKFLWEYHPWVSAFGQQATEAHAGVPGHRRADADERGVFGLVEVRVVEAKGVLASDFSVLPLLQASSSDPYAVVTVGQHSTVVSRTPHINNTVNPHWDRRFVMPVSSPFAQVRVRVYDHDVVGDDDELGEVEVPIWALEDGNVHDLWLPLQFSPGMDHGKDEGGDRGGGGGASSDGTAGKQHKKKTAAAAVGDTVGTGAAAAATSGSGAAATSSKALAKRRQSKVAHNARQRQIQELRRQASTDGSADDDSDEDLPFAGKDVGLGKIRLRLHMRHSRPGEFFSHFAPESAPPPEPVPFGVNAFYGAIMKLVAMVMPLLNPVFSVVGMIGWQQPWWSALCVIVFVWLCLHPGWIPVWVHLLILKSLFWKYVDNQYRLNKPGATVEEPAALVATRRHARGRAASRGGGGGDESDATTVVRDEGELTEFVKVVSEAKKAKEAQTLGLLGTVADVVVTEGLSMWLQGIQNTLQWVADLIETIYAVFDWSSPSTTKWVTVGVAISLVVHCIVPFRYILLVIGLVLFSLQTRPWQLALQGIMGCVSYSTSSLAKQRANAEAQALAEQA